MSIEGSADGSFDVDMDFPEGAEEWEDEHEGDDSLEGILDGAGLDRAMGGLTICKGKKGISIWIRSTTMGRMGKARRRIS